MIDAVIQELVTEGCDDALCPDPARLAVALNEIMAGDVQSTQIAAMLMGMRIRGEKPEHLKVVVETMLAHAMPFPGDDIGGIIADTCGPGGTGRSTVNISTASALLAAAAGVRVAKHGNRSVSSRSGSSDVLQALGYKIDCLPVTSARLLRDFNFCFLFAPLYHPSMKHAATARRDIKVRTIFNLAGPLSNPALPTHQLVGVGSPELIPLMVDTLRMLGREQALIVNGNSGHDEISATQKTKAVLLRVDGSTQTFIIDPKEIIQHPVTPEALNISSPAESAEKIRRVLEGADNVVADETNLNVGAVLWLVGRAKDLRDGYNQALAVQRSGAGAKLLDTLVAESNKDA